MVRRNRRLVIISSLVGVICIVVINAMVADEVIVAYAARNMWRVGLLVFLAVGINTLLLADVIRSVYLYWKINRDRLRERWSWIP